jgi:hypothetical protein
VVIADRVVTWGKHEEEERLTGRQENRRTLVEWVAVLVSTSVLVIIAIVAVLMTATLILRARDASLAPPGEKYFVDGKIKPSMRNLIIFPMIGFYTDFIFQYR